MKTNAVTHKIIGCAMKVHTALKMVFRKLFINALWRLKCKNKVKNSNVKKKCLFIIMDMKLVLAE